MNHQRKLTWAVVLAAMLMATTIGAQVHPDLTGADPILISSVGQVGGTGTPPLMRVFSGWGDWGDIGRLVDEVLNNAWDPVGRAIGMAKRATERAVAGDLDGATNDLLAQMSAFGSISPFRDTIFEAVRALTPAQCKSFTEAALGAVKQMDGEITDLRVQTYRSLYDTYRRDAVEFNRRMSERDFDFTEYRRYSLYYAVATADWSSPAAAEASALRIGEDQYAAYSFYSSHRYDGAAIGAARNRVGLTDDYIKQGVRELTDPEKSVNGLGTVAVAISTHFVISGRAAQCEANQDYCETGTAPCDNAPWLRQTLNIGNKTDIPIAVLMHVVNTRRSYCYGRVADVAGVLQPGEYRMCQVFGTDREADVQVTVSAWNPAVVKRTGDRNPAWIGDFDKAAGNKVELNLDNNRTLWVDCGNTHWGPITHFDPR